MTTIRDKNYGSHLFVFLKLCEKKIQYLKLYGKLYKVYKLNLKYSLIEIKIQLILICNRKMYDIIVWKIILVMEEI